MAKENNENLTVLEISDIRTMKKDIAWLQAGGKSLLDEKRKENEKKARKFIEKQVYEEEEKNIVTEIRSRAEQEKLKREIEEARRIEEERRKIEESRKKAEEERRKIEEELKKKEEEERLLQEERRKIEEIRQKTLEKIKQEKEKRQKIKMQELQKIEMERLKHQEEEEEKRMTALKEERWAMEEKRRKILQEIKQKEEEEKKRLEEIKIKVQESFRRKQEELERKRKEKEEKIIIAENLRKIAVEKREIELKRSSLLKKIWPIDKTINIILRKESNLAERLKEIEEREMVVGSGSEKREIEKERWALEDKRRQAEKELLPWLKEKEKFQAQIDQIEKEYADVLAREELLKEKQKEIFAKEEKVRLSKKRAELENLFLGVNQEKESILLERDKIYQELLEIEDRLKVVIEKERKVEEDKFLLEEKEEQISEEEKVSLKQQRWQLEEKRRQVEKERWQLEDEKKQVELKIRNIEEELQRIEEKEIEIKEEIKEIDIKLSGSLEESIKKSEKIFTKEFEGTDSFSVSISKDLKDEGNELFKKNIKDTEAIKKESKSEEQKPAESTESVIQPSIHIANQKIEDKIEAKEVKKVEGAKEEKSEQGKDNNQEKTEESNNKETILQAKNQEVDSVDAKRRVEEAKKRIEFLREELRKQRIESEIEERDLGVKKINELDSFSIKNETDKSNLLFPNEIKNNQDVFREEESKDDFNKDLEKIKKEQIELQRQFFKDVKKEDKVPAPTSLSEIPQPSFSGEKPSLFQKIGMRIAVLFVFLIIIAGIIFFLYWFFRIRPAPIPPLFYNNNQSSTTSAKSSKDLFTTTTTTSTLTSATTSTTTPSLRDEKNFPSGDLIQVGEDKFIFRMKVSNLEEIPNALSLKLKEKFPPNKFIYISIILGENNELIPLIKDFFKLGIEGGREFSLKDFLNIFKINTPKGFLDKVEDNISLFIYSLGQNNQLVIMIEEREDTSKILSNWEKTMVKDLNSLSSILGNTKKPANASFKTSKYKGIPFRCIDFYQRDFGICYVRFQGELLFTWSGKVLIKLIDKLT